MFVILEFCSIYNIVKADLLFLKDLCLILRIVNK